MKSPADLLASLRKAGITLRLGQGKLIFNAPKGMMTTDLRQQLQQQKERLIAYLESIQPIPKAPRDKPLPLSSSQERLWILDSIEGSNPIYNLSGAVNIHGPLDFNALEASFNGILERHEVLRTFFQDTSQGPVQIIEEHRPYKLPLVNLEGLADDAREKELAHCLDEESERPFNLGRRPLLRFKLFYLGTHQYTLLINMHHIISDAWSLGVFSHELSLHYNALVHGRTPGLPGLPVQYADFSAWQRRCLQQGLLQESIAYWKKQLADAPVLSGFPTDKPRPPVQTYAGKRQRFQIPARLLEKTEELARHTHCTLFMVLLAAFMLLINRYSGKTDIITGTPAATRNHVDLEPLIGFFVNTLALRVDFSGNPTFRELLAQIRSMTLAAYQHQEVPFEHLVEILQPVRNMNHAPLVQLMFVLQNAPMHELSLENLETETIVLETNFSKLDLTLSMEKNAEGMSALWEYNTDLFYDSSIRRLQAYFTNLLEIVGNFPEAKIKTLTFLPDEDEKQLRLWNASEYHFGLDNVKALFEQKASQYPDNTALGFNGGELSYKELNQRANRLAQRILQEGGGNGTIVGVCMERSPLMITALLAIMKSASAYMIMDPAYPQERLALMLEDAKPALILSQQQQENNLPPHHCAVFHLEEEDCGDTQQAVDNPAIKPLPSAPAYVIYTSGSTGKPKGVLVSQTALANLVQAQIRRYQVEATSTLLQFVSLNFDVAAGDIFTALCGGSRLELLPSQTVDGLDLLRVLQEQRVTHLELPVAMLAALPPTNLPALTCLVVGGEACSIDMVRQWGGGRKFFNAYGPSEATICSTVAQLKHDDRQVHIGFPLDNVTIHILDTYFNHQPPGVPGELHIGGAGVALEYINRPGLTAEKFIPDPFSGRPGTRLYKTGDLARYLEDGRIEFIGRIDAQVKIRGFRIETGEIEAVLRSCPLIKDTVVTAVSSGTHEGIEDLHLNAYLVPRDEKIDDETLITGSKRYLREHLPDYMQPAVFIRLDKLPLNVNGKIDKKALPLTSPPSVKDHFIEPRTETEQKVSALWCNLLGLRRISREADFFALGGHSLLATRLSSHLRDHLKWEVPVKQIFEHPVLKDFCAVLDGHSQSREEHLPDFIRYTKELNPPLSFAQIRLWFLAQMIPNSALYNIPMAVQIEGPLQADILQTCFQTIIRRHETLRASFGSKNGVPRQRIRPGTDCTLTRHDLSGLLPTQRRQSIIRLAAEDMEKPFDLENDLLIRISLLRLHEQKHVLLLNMHHIVADGWSVGVLLKELKLLYTAFVQNKPSPLPPLTVQYADFAAWQRSWLRGKRLQQQIDYWKKQLENIPELLELPLDHPRPAMLGLRGGSERFMLTQELTADLKALCKQSDSTLFMLLLACFMALLARYSRQNDIVVGTPVANRRHTGTEALIGFFVNTLVMRGDLSNNPKFSDFLQSVRHMTLAAYDHQDIPFEQLVEVLKPVRSLQHSPLFQVMFVLQNLELEELELPGLKLTRFEIPYAQAKFDLTLNMEETAEGLQGLWEYNSNLFEAAGIHRLHKHFQHLLEAVVKNPQQRLDALPILNHAETDQLLREWNNTLKDYPLSCLHHLFEEHAAKTPQNIAVLLEEDSLTYSALNQQANRLAHYLLKMGMGPEKKAAIYIPRSFDMITALLAVLKTGGAFIPIDVEYPSNRIGGILEDARPLCLITLSKLQNTLPAHGANVLCLDTERTRIDTWPSDNPVTAVIPQNAAYIIYTSGSTGKPKGVVLTHFAYSYYSHWLHSCCPMGAQDKILQKNIFGFDVSVAEIFTALLTGAQLVLAKPGGHRDLDYLAHLIYRQKISCCLIGPSSLQLLAEHSAFQKAKSLRYVFSGGETVPVPLAKTIGKHLKNTAVCHVYGPTETCVNSTCLFFDEKKHGNINTLPIGRPIDNTCLYVLDDYLNPVPVGVVGELHIAGTGLARGYLNSPALTAEKFIPNPLNGTMGGRLYKTGDLVRYLADGNIEFIGRMDHQVKIRGFRIEPGEIEATLQKHPDVRATAIIAHQDKTGNIRLVAYVVSGLIPERLAYETECVLENNGCAIDVVSEDISSSGVGVGRLPPGCIPQVGMEVNIRLKLPGDSETVTLPGTIAWYSQQQAGITFHVDSEQQYLINRSITYLFENQHYLKMLQRAVAGSLREYLEKRLPDYMMPAGFIIMDALPLTRNGKLDRRALPKPDEILFSTLQNRFVAPNDPLQLQLARIWEEVLQHSPVGIQDNFFELGGHSLRAVQVIAKIKQQLGKQLPLAALFEKPTIDHLAHLIRHSGNYEWSPLVSLHAQSGEVSLFAVHPVGGNVVCYAELARCLSKRQDFYAFQSAGLETEQTMPASIEEMAAQYICEMRKIQPEGPYYLTGWSMGGLIAFEMAKQLNAQGQKIGLLALLDTWEPSTAKEFSGYTEDRPVEFLARHLAGMHGKQDALHLDTRHSHEHQLEQLLTQGKLLGILPQEIELPLLQKFFKVFEHNLQLSRAYKSTAYHGDIVLIRAARQADNTRSDNSLGWHAFVRGKLTIHSLDGDHYSILQSPLVEELATYLNLT